jgi:hypothetical protein
VVELGIKKKGSKIERRVLLLTDLLSPHEANMSVERGKEEKERKRHSRLGNFGCGESNPISL